ncbi:Hpt domain-containing protein [Rugamonas apoptosis]|uniref:Hpt domain-containing protein n=1 Tax=Rugamonas apoptosis TaxID=2758570 RepID=A0A7W2FA41_9BURK|nr:Hpt domain-containing protein [Rugamonas apoptosis]MBA5687911.1 Hpt domain-containing protein [Rugamonas apoptosis]
MTAGRYHAIAPEVLMGAVAGDLASFRSLSQVYLAIAPPGLARMRAARAAGDLRALAHESHALKGSAVLVGAQALCALLQQIELLAGAAGGADLVALWPALEQQFGLVMDEVTDSIDHYHGTPGRGV